MRQLLVPAALAVLLGGCEVSFGTGAEDSSGANEAAAAATARFVNSPENAGSAVLREHYVDFSFDYPASWRVSPERSERNYVRVAAPYVDGYEPYAFHVGYAYGSGDAEQDARDIEQALPQIAEQFGSTLPDYQVTSVGRDRVGGYDSWTWRFSSAAPGTGGTRPAAIYGRGDVILPPGAERGVLLVTLVTDRAGEVDNPAEVGESGPVKAIFDSFRLGGNGGAAAE